MSHHKSIPLLLLCFMGCKDKPYKEQVAAPKAELAAYGFSGVVELGAPVSGARIAAYQFGDLKKGEIIGEALSSHDGTFNLTVKTNYEGPLLLVATGGTYKDLVSGEIAAIKPTQELSSAITHIKMPEKTNINAWTTMAVARVFADQGFWDKSVAGLKDVDRINVDFSHISYFLAGKSGDAINIRRQEFLDVEKDSMALGDPRVVLHLAHGGLSRLAKNYSAKLVNDGAATSAVDLVLALADDLTDRLFDGKNVLGEAVFVGNGRRINLSSYTLRKDLSEAIFHYSKQLRASGRLSDDDLLELRSAGKLLDSIAGDARPELFPEQERPRPFDIDVPEIQIKFAEKHQDEEAFSPLDGDVFFAVSAKDDSSISKIALLAPKLESADKEGIFGPMSIEHQQNSMEIAIACDKRGEFQSELKMRALKREDVFCACFEATDDAGNTQRQLSCFQREKPKATILSPENKATLARADLSQGIKVEATIASGVMLTECFWSIYGQHSAVPLLKGEGRIAGTKCVIAENIDKDQLRSGDYSLAVKAADIAGRAPSRGYLADFTVRHDLVDGLPGRIIGPRS